MLKRRGPHPKRRSRPPIGRLIVWTGALLAPTAITFFVLVLLGRIDGGTAVVAVVGVATGLWGFAWFVVSGLQTLRRHIDSEDDALSRGIPLAAGIAPELASALARRQRLVSAKIEELELQAEASDLVLDRLPTPLILVDARMSVVGINNAARRIVGSTAMGGQLSGVIRDPSVLEAVEKTIASLGSNEAEFGLPAPVEREFVAFVTALPPAIADRAAVVIALQDVTTVRRIDQMRADFIANVSHELRTPLSTLIGFIETLRGPASEDETARQRFLTIMQEQAERMSRLIRDLMSLSRIEMHEHTPPTEVVDAIAVVQSVSEIMQIEAAEKNIRFRLDVPDSPTNVVGDADELTQVLQNLVDNAIKYSRPDSTVVLTVARVAKDRSAGRQRDSIAISVTDEGEGIPQEHVPRLTERFYRVDSARSRQMGGTGLGLAIVKHILNRHGGTLQIESRRGEGSTFTITVPAEAVAATVEGA